MAVAEWRAIPGWEGLYEASSLGQVKSLGRTLILEVGGRAHRFVYPEKIMKASLCNGYPRVKLTSADGGRKMLYLHQIICMTFHGPAPEGCQVAHGDGNRENPAAANLRWATRKENMADTWAHGTHRCGVKINGAKLNDNAVVAIRRDPRRHEDIRKEYGLSVGVVSRIKARKAWAHVGEAA